MFDIDQDPQKAESDLDGHITISTNLAGTALKHMQMMPNASTLAAVTRAIDLLQFFLPQAERLRDQNRPALYARLVLIIDDVTAARNTWAQTLGILVAADIKDTKREIAYQASSIAQQKKLHEDILKQEQQHAAENKKLL